MDERAFTEALRRHAVIGRGHEAEPLVDYAIVATTFVALTGTAIVHGLRRGALPRRIPLEDVVLLGLATARLSRLVTREKVARPLRAPFTEVAPDAKPDEVKELARGEGITRVLGELLTCPRCFGVWASAALSIAYVSAPGPVRIASEILAASLINDWANVRFARARAHAR